MEQIIEFLNTIEQTFYNVGIGGTVMIVIGFIFKNKIYNLIPGVKNELQGQLSEANKLILKQQNNLDNVYSILGQVVQDVINNPYITPDKKEKYLAIQAELNGNQKIVEQILDVAEDIVDVVENITGIGEY